MGTESGQLFGGYKAQKPPTANVTEVDNIVVHSPPDVLEVVRGGDDLGGAGVEVVVGVLGDDGAAAHEVVGVAEDEAGPGELSGRGLSVLQTPHRTRVLSTPCTRVNNRDGNELLRSLMYCYCLHI